MRGLYDSQSATVDRGRVGCSPCFTVRLLSIDRVSCPYTEGTLADPKYMRASMLRNPFEKFERMRFLYHSRDLGVISVNHALLARLTDEDLAAIRAQMRAYLEAYYEGLGG